MKSTCVRVQFAYTHNVILLDVCWYLLKMTTIEFQIDLPEYPNEPSPYVHIANPDKDIRGMVNADERVITGQFRFIVDYPLSRAHVETCEGEGFTRAEIARIVCETYKRLYKEEDGDERPGCIPGMYNRVATEGPHGIWGHYIEDLLLHSVKWDADAGLWYLGVDS